MFYRWRGGREDHGVHPWGGWGDRGGVSDPPGPVILSEPPKVPRHLPQTGPADRGPVLDSHGGTLQVHSHQKWSEYLLGQLWFSVLKYRNSIHFAAAFVILIHWIVKIVTIHTITYAVINNHRCKCSLRVYSHHIFFIAKRTSPSIGLWRFSTLCSHMERQQTWKKFSNVNCKLQIDWKMWMRKQIFFCCFCTYTM